MICLQHRKICLEVSEVCLAHMLGYHGNENDNNHILAAQKH